MDQYTGFICNLSHRRKVIAQHRLTATDPVHHRRHTGSTWPASIEGTLPIECFRVLGINLSMRFSQRLHSRVLWVDQRRPHVCSSGNNQFIRRKVADRLSHFLHRLVQVVSRQKAPVHPDPGGLREGVRRQGFVHDLVGDGVTPA